jgi:hypothetical protein
MDVMATIVKLNAMEKTITRAAEKMVDPPLLLPDDDILSGYSFKAGSLVYGAVDEQGRPLAHPLQTGGQLPVGLEMSDRCRSVINEAFFLTLFQVLLERTPNQTATEVIERSRERAQLLAPIMGRQQDEMLRPIIEREMDIIVAAGGLGLLGPMPEGLRAAGGYIQPQYASEMYQALAAVDGQATLRFMEGLAMAMQFDPAAADNFNADAATRVLFKTHGVPAEVQRSEQEVGRLRKARAEQEAQAQQMAMMTQGIQEAGAAAQAIKTGAEANQIMESGNA